MTLEEFIQEQHERVEKFKADYERNNAKDQEVFPLDLAPGQWDEQLQIFEGGDND